MVAPRRDYEKSGWFGNGGDVDDGSNAGENTLLQTGEKPFKKVGEGVGEV
jgi:hypothetical protein